MPEDSLIIPFANPTQDLNLAQFYSTPAPLEVDLGCGKGRFIAARAQAHPKVNFLGIDRLLSRLERVERKVLRAKLTNVRLLRLEAAYTVTYLLPAHSVSMFHIFFPDPWPKRRHHQRRLFNPAFLDALSKTLQPNGQVNLATDHLAYFNEIHKLLSNDPRFTEIPAFEPRDEERTDFERRFMGQGLPIGRCSFQRHETD